MQLKNEILFPAGIMQIPYFSYKWPSFLQYGAFGAVVSIKGRQEILECMLAISYLTWFFVFFFDVSLSRAVMVSQTSSYRFGLCLEVHHIVFSDNKPPLSFSFLSPQSPQSSVTPSIQMEDNSIKMVISKTGGPTTLLSSSTNVEIV